MDPREINPQFFRMVSILASTCWQQLGKSLAENGGPVSRDLAAAQSTIEMLIMLRDKTQGNLTGTEEKILNDTIARLQEVCEEESAKEA